MKTGNAPWNSTLGFNYQVVEFPVVTTQKGDVLKRCITAGSEGATFRFLNKNGDKYYWNELSHIEALVRDLGLNANSTNSEICDKVGWWIKTNGTHTQGYGTFAPILDNKGNDISNKYYTSLMSDVYTQSKLCSHFNQVFPHVISQICNYLGRANIDVFLVSLPVHQSNQYLTEMGDTVYIDVDPGSTTFKPRKEGEAVSLSKLIKEPKIFLDPTSLTWNNGWENSPDSVSRILSYNFMDYNLSDIKQIHYYLSPISFDSSDFYYKLLPGQSLIWQDTVNTLVLNYGECPELYIKLILKFSSNPDSLSIYKLIKSIAKCHQVSVEEFSDAIFSNSLHFGSETGYIVNPLREVFFTTNLSNGCWDETEIYFQHPIRSVKGGDVLINGKTLHDGFYWGMYEFEDSDSFSVEITDTVFQKINQGLEIKCLDSVELTFYGSHLQEGAIALLDGAIETKILINGKEQNNFIINNSNFKKIDNFLYYNTKTNIVYLTKKHPITYKFIINLAS